MVTAYRDDGLKERWQQLRTLREQEIASHDAEARIYGRRRARHVASIAALSTLPVAGLLAFLGVPVKATWALVAAWVSYIASYGIVVVVTPLVLRGRLRSALRPTNDLYAD